MDALQANAESPRIMRLLQDLPGPRGIPVLGNLLQIDSLRFHQQLEAWAAQHGSLYRLSFGRQQALVVGDHAVTAAVLRDRPNGFSRTKRLVQIATEMGLPAGLFGAEGEAWSRQRRMVMAGFDPAHVRRYFPAMQGVAARLVGRWQKSIGAPIDLQADLMRYTVDTISGLAFGAEVNTLESDEDVIQQHLDRIFPALFQRTLSPFPTWRWWRSKADRELEQSLVAVNAAIADFIAKARQRMAEQPHLREHPANLLEAMIAAADVEGIGIDDGQVAGNVLTMLLAGEDTTANTLAWLIDLLWRHPAALARARDEIRQHDDGRPWTQDRLDELRFVDACLHEAMRLKPVAPLIFAQALHEDMTVGDVRVPRHTIVVMLMRRDSTSETHLANAAAFEPERWLGGGEAGLNAGSAKRISMPFGAGPRICPGRYLALLEMKLAMAVLLANFDITALETPDGGEAREQLAFTMAPQGLTMRLSHRVP